MSDPRITGVKVSSHIQERNFDPKGVIFDKRQGLFGAGHQGKYDTTLKGLNDDVELTSDVTFEEEDMEVDLMVSSHSFNKLRHLETNNLHLRKQESRSAVSAQLISAFVLAPYREWCLSTF